MADKQINELFSISAMGETDLVAMYDLDEAGTEKTKKITYADFKKGIDALTYNDTTAILTVDSSGVDLTDGTTASSLKYNGTTLELTQSSVIVKLWSSTPRFEVSISGQVMFQADTVVSINHSDGSKAIETASDNIDFYGSTAARRFQIHPHDTANTKLISTNPGAGVDILGRNTANTADNTILSGDPDGAFEANFAGSKVIWTTTNGIRITGTGNVGYLEIEDPDDSGQLVRIQSTAGICYHDVYNSGAGTSAYQLRIDNGTVQNVVINSNYLGISLYYNNALCMEVTTNGIKVKGTSAETWLQHNHANNAFELTPYNANAGFTFYCVNGSYIQEHAIKGISGGAVEIYHAGNLALGTTSSGGAISHPTATTPIFAMKSNVGTEMARLSHGGAHLDIVNATASGNVYIKSRNTGNTADHTCFYGDPDGASGLYQNNKLAFRTYSQGGIQYYTSTGATTAGYIYDKAGAGFTMESPTGIDIAFNHVNDKMLVCKADGGVEFYYDNAKTAEVTVIGMRGNIDIDPTPDTDHTANGTIITATVDVNATGIGALLYLASDGNYEEADADAATTMPVTAMALEAGTGSKKVLLFGFFRDDTYAWTPGVPLYCDTTTGAVTATKPSGTGDQVQRIGIAYTADVIYFKPDLTVIEV
jgi:hypothetical protein